MKAARAVTVIPPTISRYAPAPDRSISLRRVAAYARVSTDNEEQLSSYEAQVDYYARYIQAKPEWAFVKVYTDEGISAISTKKRDGFNRMIRDALDGKIDMIITKSVSRFARNTVDTLTTVRKLKEKGVEVYFEKENIYTLDSKGELLITIMSSLAQEESRSISENVTWGQRKRFADGKVSMPYKQFLGYEKGEDGLPKIVESEAAIVRLIYKLYLEGKSPSGIAKRLTDSGIATPSGKAKWQPSTVESILSNEKYMGDAILQKSFTVDFLTKKMKPNEGEVPQYYVENSHPAIISRDIFNLVQHEMKIRGKNRSYNVSGSCFSGKIICGVCGSIYGSKVWHSSSKYRRTIWQCNGKFKGEKECSTPHFYEDELKELFVKAMNSRISNQEGILSTYREVIAELTGNTAYEKEAETLRGECDVTLELIRKMVNENASATLDQSEYMSQYSYLADRHKQAQDRLAELNEIIGGRIVRRQKIEQYLKILERQEFLLADFDQELWNSMVSQLLVRSTVELVFVFKDGSELPLGRDS